MERFITIERIAPTHLDVCLPKVLNRHEQQQTGQPSKLESFAPCASYITVKSSARQKCCRWADSAGNEMWSLNLVVGDDDSTYAEVTLLLQGYDRG